MAEDDSKPPATAHKPLSGHQLMGRLAQAETLSDMVLNGYNVELICGGCSTARVVPPQPLQDLCLARGWPTDIFALGSQLVCQQCGRRWPTLRATVKEAGEPIGPVTIDDYRRLMIRMARLLNLKAKR